MRKDHVITVRLNPNEYDVAWKQCKKKGAKLSEMVRVVLREFLTRAPEPKEDELNLLRNQLRQLSGIGRNLNQITRAIHQGKAPGNDRLQVQLNELQEYAKTNQLMIANMVKKTQQRHTKIMKMDWKTDGKK